MTARKTTARAAALFFAITLCLASGAFAGDAYFAGTKISFERAVQIASDSAGGGAVTEAEWESKYGRPLYTIEIIRSGREHEIKIDAVTGEILKSKSERESSAPLGIAASLLTTARSNELAKIAVTKAGGGTVTKIKHERKAGRTITEVKVNNNGARHEIKIDAETKRVIRSESKLNR